MAQFSVNATRFDPYKNFKFRVKWDAGPSRCAADCRWRVRRTAIA